MNFELVSIRLNCRDGLFRTFFVTSEKCGQERAPSSPAEVMEKLAHPDAIRALRQSEEFSVLVDQVFLMRQNAHFPRRLFSAHEKHCCEPVNGLTLSTSWAFGESAFCHKSDTSLVGEPDDDGGCSISGACASTYSSSGACASTYGDSGACASTYGVVEACKSTYAGAESGESIHAGGEACESTCAGDDACDNSTHAHASAGDHDSTHASTAPGGATSESAAPGDITNAFASGQQKVTTPSASADSSPRRHEAKTPAADVQSAADVLIAADLKDYVELFAEEGFTEIEDLVGLMKGDEKDGLNKTWKDDLKELGMNMKDRNKLRDWFLNFEKDSALQPDRAVECRFGGGSDWSAGRIDRRFADGTYAVEYDDGDYEERVHPELIRVPAEDANLKSIKDSNQSRQELKQGGGEETSAYDSMFQNQSGDSSDPLPAAENDGHAAHELAALQPGTAVECRFGGGSDWSAGRIDRRFADGTYAVEYDDGDYEERVHPELIRVPAEDANLKSIKDSNQSRQELKQGGGEETSAYDSMFQNQSGDSSDALPAGESDGHAAHEHVGTAVECRFGGGLDWYAGRIDAANADGTYAVEYDNGDYEEGVHPELIRVCPNVTYD